MKFLFKSLFMFILFVYLVIVFLPKDQLYYFGLENLKSKEIFVVNKKVDSLPFDLILEDSTLFVKSIEAATINNVKMNILLFKNRLSVTEVSINESFSKFVPNNIDNLNIEYQLSDPLHVNITFNGKEYKGFGKINLLEQKLNLTLLPSNSFVRKYPMIIKQLKKVSNKEYSYEYSL